MSNTQGYGTEVLYQMPSVGATKTTTTQSIVSGNAAGNPAYQLPALASIWPPDKLQGKSLQILAGGTYDSTNVGNTMILAFDSSQGTFGTLIAGTGSALVPSTTTGMWTMQLLLTCTSVGNNTSGWMTSGFISYGVGNNAATAAATTIPMGGANALGVPTSLALATSATIGYIELWSTFATAPTAFVCSQFLIQGMN